MADIVLAIHVLLALGLIVFILLQRSDVILRSKPTKGKIGSGGVPSSLFEIGKKGYSLFLLVLSHISAST